MPANKSDKEKPPEAANADEKAADADSPPTSAEAEPEEVGLDADAATADGAEDAEDEIDPRDAEIADTKDKLLRALAETENVRRRAERDRGEASKYGVAAMAREFLDVSDNLRRALDSVPPEEIAKNEALKTLTEGVAMTERTLLAVFERHGIRKIEPMGEKFDYNFHQAMFEVPDPVNPPGTVVQVMQPGYLIHDRLLRPAMVGVAKAAEDSKPVDTTA